MAEKQKNPVKTISLVMVLTLAGKLLGLLRDRLMTVSYGSGMETNAFITASLIPRAFFDALFASAVTASFIPVFSEIAAKKGRRDAIEFSGSFITVVAVLTLALTVLGVIFAGPLVTLFADGYDAATTALCVSLTRVMFPAVLFTGIAYSFIGILQSLDEFNVPALVSVVANLVIIAYYFTLNERFGIYGLACAFLLAWFVQAAIQVPSLVRKGFFFRPSLGAGSEGMKKVLVLMLPVMVSTWVQPVNLTINTKFGSRLFDGFGAAAVNLSNNLYLIIIGVFIMSVANVIFPRLSRLTAVNEADMFRATLGRTVRTSMYFVIPMTAGLAILARPVVDLIYGGGEFGDKAVDITARALSFVSLGMVGYSLQAVLSRAYFARQNGLMPLISGFSSIAVNIALCLLLSDRLGIAGLAVASAAAVTVNAALLIIPLEARGQGFLSRALIFDLLKMIIAALIMAGAVWALRRTLEGRCAGTLWKAVAAAVPAAAGVIVYAAATALLGLEEAVKAAGILKKRLVRK